MPTLAPPFFDNGRSDFDSGHLDFDKGDSDFDNSHSVFDDKQSHSDDRRPSSLRSLFLKLRGQKSEMVLLPNS